MIFKVLMMLAIALLPGGIVLAAIGLLIARARAKRKRDKET
jgi:hypothetical protein